MDGDRYHKCLKWRYQLLYKQIGQGHFSDQELGYNALQRIKQDAKDYGNGVIEALGRIADEIEKQMALPELRQLVDADAFKVDFEQMLQVVDGHSRGKHLALRSCERYLNELDLTSEVRQVRQTLIAGYFQEIYVANFESPASISPEVTKPDIAHVDVLDRLSFVREHVDVYTVQMAETVARSLSLDRVRMPASPRAAELVELDEILCC